MNSSKKDKIYTDEKFFTLYIQLKILIKGMKINNIVMPLNNKSLHRLFITK